MLGYYVFFAYTCISLAVPIYIVNKAVNEHDTIFGTLVDLTSYKLNLMIFFNAMLMLLVQFSNWLVWLFFDDIRIIEQKYVLEKSQKKVFQFLLLSIVLRNSFDIYKMIGLAILFFVCIIHWLVNKRSDYLISRASREWKDHAKIMILGNILNLINFFVSYSFIMQFSKASNDDEKIGNI